MGKMMAAGIGFFLGLLPLPAGKLPVPVEGKTNDYSPAFLSGLVAAGRILGLANFFSGGDGSSGGGTGGGGDVPPPGGDVPASGAATTEPPATVTAPEPPATVQHQSQRHQGSITNRTISIPHQVLSLE